MKKNSIDFSIPRRQSYSAIIFFIYRFFKIVVRQLWPILLAFLFGKEQFKTTLLYVVIGISVLILVFSIISYFKYFFYLKGDELIVEKGIFQKSKTNISFERIQTINEEQSLLHQLFNVVKLEIDTAGSKGNEFSFASLDKEVADELKSIILSKKSELSKGESSFDQEHAENDSSFRSNLIMRLSPSELFKLGLGQNHLRSFFLIIIFSSWIMDQLRELGVSTDEVMTEIEKESLMMGKELVLILAFGAIFITLLISLIRTFLRYYDFRLLRTEGGFKVDAGLLNRRQVSAKDHKIQMISWADNPLKRMMDMRDVFLKQASSVEVQNKRSIIIPGCNSDNLEKIKNQYFEENDWMNLEEFMMSRLYIRRTMFYSGILPFLFVFCTLYYFTDIYWALLSIIWLAFAFVGAQVSYRKFRFSINEKILYLHKGLFGNYNKSMKLYKIQNIKMVRSIYHRMNDIANIVVYTASGRISIPYIPLALAERLMDYFLYKTESTDRNWM